MEFEQCKPGTEELRAGSVLGVFECCVESCTGQANLVREISLLSNIMGNHFCKPWQQSRHCRKLLTVPLKEAWQLHTRSELAVAESTVLTARTGSPGGLYRICEIMENPLQWPPMSTGMEEMCDMCQEFLPWRQNQQCWVRCGGPVGLSMVL